jgi:SAM-dependent methyltransferase
MSQRADVEVQRAFYESRVHQHLRPREDDHYARKLARELARRSGIDARHRVLELGAGFGRFTFPLLESCASVVALDLSERVLRELERFRDERGIQAARCRTWCGDATSLSEEQIPHDGTGPAKFDFAVGFFVLHHLPDVAGAIRGLARLLVPGGGMTCLEPNRRNPQYVAQVMVCPDMTWREEKGMFTMSPRSVDEALCDAGLTPAPAQRFGFFPPPLFNRFAVLRRLEDRLERSALLEPVLPFHLFQARLPAGAAR